MKQKIIYKTVIAALCSLLLYLPGMAQNTATTTGNWNACTTWGNPSTLFQGNTDTKTINTGVTVTLNTSWSTHIIDFISGTGIIDFAATSNFIDLVNDNGADQTCTVPNVIQNPTFNQGSTFANWNNQFSCWLADPATYTNRVGSSVGSYEGDGANCPLTQTVSNVRPGATFSFQYAQAASPTVVNPTPSKLTVSYAGTIYVLATTEVASTTQGSVVAQNGATGGPFTTTTNSSSMVNVSFTLPASIPSSGVLAFAYISSGGAAARSDDIKIANLFLSGN